MESVVDHQSILDRRTAPPVVEGDMPGSSAIRSATASVSAGIAAANAHLPELAAAPGPRFPAEDGGRSLAEIAHSDLDAALQLLAERAQYITGASGAAIALRRGQHSDMLCRASAGSNAPELGALLSMEHGLSGESVRTRQALRCDDAERDPRVNREGCRELGIASVVVMPIISGQQVLGVFELFSGQVRAFGERDISALQRLSEMVETAVKYAAATPVVPEMEAPADEARTNEARTNKDWARVEIEPVAVEAAPEAQPKALAKTELEGAKTNAEPQPAPLAASIPVGAPAPAPGPTPKKPLFWSAAMQTQANDSPTGQTAAPSIAVPAGLRNLQKCQACGFPVSQGRNLCVECEEKHWRGQRLPKAAAVAATPPQSISSSPISLSPAEAVASLVEPAASSSEPLAPAANISAADEPTLFLSSAAPSQSWFAANKFVLGALLVVALVVAAVVWLR